jgi:hypothetical protein
MTDAHQGGDELPPPRPPTLGDERVTAPEFLKRVDQPPPTLPPVRRSWWARNRAALIAVSAVVGGIAVYGPIAGARHKSNTPTMSLTEAACKLLREGETTDRTYEIAKDLARDHPYTYPDAGLSARAAVDQAVAQGCQS